MTRVRSLVRWASAALCAVAVPAASVNALEGEYPAPDYDWSSLTEDRYRTETASRAADLASAETRVGQAEAAFKTAHASHHNAREETSQAWNLYLGAYSSGNEDDTIEAWRAVGRALRAQAEARREEQTKADLLQGERRNLTYKQFWKARLENDWRDAQAARGAVGAHSVPQDIARCRSGGGRLCSASGLLGSDTRFTVFQPVHEMVGVHHAHAKGLTGAGVRVAVEDDAVNYRLPEFAGRVSFEGARLVYPRPLSTAKPFGATDWWYDSVSYNPWETQDPHIHEAITVDAILGPLGQDWTEEFWLENRHEDVLPRDRWVVIPAVESENGPSHGTRVASVAVGRDFGVAPGATLIPIFKDFSRSGQNQQNTWSRYLLNYVSRASASTRTEWDEYLARSVRADYANYDVVNRSFGIGVFDEGAIQSVLHSGTNWWGEELRRLLPLTWRAYMQTHVHPDDRAVVVYATGNSQEEFGGLGANLPFHEPHLRGHHLAVMAVDADGAHAFYSNFCGPLPSDWDAGRWGRHYCLAAPGRVNAASNRPDYAFQGTEGTSFAAPIVTGSVALLMEHFRGQLGNTEVAKRIVNTADNRDRFAQTEIYGAGLLDIEAALRPVGRVVTGTTSVRVDTASTVIEVPAAFGLLGQRLEETGVEIASLDSWGAPFWTAPGSHVRTVENPSNPIPRISEPGRGAEDRPHTGFAPETLAAPISRTGRFRLLIGDDRIGMEQAPREGFRWGIVGDGASWLGGRASGAFGDDLRSVTTWIGRNTRMELDNAWTFDASATLGLGRVFLEPGTMLDVDSYIMSEWQVVLEHGNRARETGSRISLSQPLRAETGQAVLTYLSGVSDGEPVYDRATTPLEPEGRELELALTHEVPVGSGRAAFKVAHSWNSGHEPGRTEYAIGASYRIKW